MGAIASGGVRILNNDLLRTYRVTAQELAAVAATEQRELERRERQYRGDREPPEITGKTIILVDDGLATGSSMRAAVAALSQEHPARIVVAVPTAAAETCADLRDEVHDVICAMTPDPFYAVGLWYEDFSQITDDEVHDLLERASGAGDGASRR